MSKEGEGKLTAKSARWLEGKSGDLTLKGVDKPLRGVTIETVKKTMILRVKPPTGDSFPVELTDLEEFKEYGTKWRPEKPQDSPQEKQLDNSGKHGG